MPRRILCMYTSDNGILRVAKGHQQQAKRAHIARRKGINGRAIYALSADKEWQGTRRKMHIP